MKLYYGVRVLGTALGLLLVLLPELDIDSVIVVVSVVVALSALATVAGVKTPNRNLPLRDAVSCVVRAKYILLYFCASSAILAHALVY